MNAASIEKKATGAPRRYPPAKVGDLFGTREVTELLPRDATSNERVRTKCRRCGHVEPGYVFNLRKAEAKGVKRCQRCPKRGFGAGPVRPPESADMRRDRLARKAANLWRAGE